MNKISKYNNHKENYLIMNAISRAQESIMSSQSYPRHQLHMSPYSNPIKQCFSSDPIRFLLRQIQIQQHMHEDIAKQEDCSMGIMGIVKCEGKDDGCAVVEFEVGMERGDAHEGDQDDVQEFPEFAEEVDVEDDGYFGGMRQGVT